MRRGEAGEREREAGHDREGVRDAGRVPGEIRHVRPGEAEGDSAAGRGACGDRPGREPEEGRRDSEARALQVPRVVLQNAAEEAYDVLGINEFNRLETTEYTLTEIPRVGGNHDETIVLLSKIN